MFIYFFYKSMKLFIPLYDATIVNVGISFIKSFPWPVELHKILWELIPKASLFFKQTNKQI